jgi:hypothetical protein
MLHKSSRLCVYAIAKLSVFGAEVLNLKEIKEDFITKIALNIVP